ncbi:D-aminoacyl-tRNA deacylase [Pelistega europaea]|uniref:D-aminoacyl-tRNA deacylase n=1 Tax=Pelistega europaea TaxID=106147 RepID=A0A7Y4LB55_9BURK|nr:D-aminoacyl-tRNA deacylase [Pelistega europaea]NOL50315.1 D-tyrosyl-tRNA(Tyr) deacylase [Pelistega europaea]
MKVVIQKVSQASVTVNREVVGAIGEGLLLLVGVGPEDGSEDIDYLVRKISQMRIFEDDAGVMNLSVLDKQAEVLCVSQFTLLASTKKGNRPSYSQAARPEVALPLFNQFVARMSEIIAKPVPTGVFGAHMEVALINDGPVTILLDSKLPT